MSSFNEIIEYVKDDLIIVKKNIEELSEKESGYSEEISKRLSYVLSSPGKQLRPVITLLCSNLFNNYDYGYYGYNMYHWYYRSHQFPDRDKEFKVQAAGLMVVAVFWNQ